MGSCSLCYAKPIKVCQTYDPIFQQNRDVPGERAAANDGSVQADNDRADNDRADNDKGKGIYKKNCIK